MDTPEPRRERRIYDRANSNLMDYMLIVTPAKISPILGIFREETSDCRLGDAWWTVTPAAAHPEYPCEVFEDERVLRMRLPLERGAALIRRLADSGFT